MFTALEPGTSGGSYSISYCKKTRSSIFLLNGTEPTYFEPDLSMQIKDKINDSWPESQETRAATCDEKDVSFCPPVAAADIQRMVGDNPNSFVSIAENASTLSDVANRHTCTHTCVKLAKKIRNGQALPGAECPPGYGDVVKPILHRGCVTNGKIRVYSSMALLS